MAKKKVMLFIVEVCIQSIKSTYHVIILRIADFSLFRFLFLLFRSQHRHPLPSVWIFFVILEAAFIVYSFFSVEFDLGLSLHDV